MASKGVTRQGCRRKRGGVSVVRSEFVVVSCLGGV